MDKKYREQAQDCIQQGEDWVDDNRSLAIKYYIKGIDFYSQIVEKTADDHIKLSKAYYFLASAYFNSKQYELAVTSYSHSINQLMQTKLNDDIYRELIELYVDLGDTYGELFNQHAANVVITNAKNAFKLIQGKTAKELALGDPDVNFLQFHMFYEQKVSRGHYLKSTKFQNNQQLLMQKKEEDEMSSLYAGFESISVAEKKQVDDELTQMFNGLAIQQQAFAPVPVKDQMPNDNDHRNLAMQFIAMARSYIDKNAIKHATNTYEQAIKALGSIKNLSKEDAQILQSLHRHNNALNKGSGKAEASPNLAFAAQALQQSSSSSARASASSFFSPAEHIDDTEDAAAYTPMQE